MTGKGRMTAKGNRKHFEHVYEYLIHVSSLFCGTYDAQNASDGYMFGIMNVMEHIAYNAGRHEEFVEMFTKNMEESGSKRTIKEILLDEVPVIRCEDCKHNVANKKIDPLDITDYSGEDIVCDYFMTDGLNPNDYCSYAERKEK